MAGLEILLRGVRVYHVTRVVHTSLAPGPFREGHAHMHKAHFICIFLFPPFFSSSFFHNNMKRTHRIWSWNAMLTPCLATHARTDLKTSCHGFPQSRLHSFSEKPVMEHSQTFRGNRVGDDVSKLSSKEPFLQEEGTVNPCSVSGLVMFRKPKWMAQ